MSLEHPIYFDSFESNLQDIISTHRPSRLLVFCDTNTKRDCLPLLSNFSVDVVQQMDAGELNKNLSTCSDFWNNCISNQIDRKALVVNLGGGVVTDLGGFASSCYKRGIQFVNIPTSLLAMVDASVGGKTGIDFGDIKNSIGSFAVPVAVLIDERFLSTLPSRQLTNGIAEILKHGFIAKRSHLDSLDEAVRENTWYRVIRESVEIKQSIVLRDPFETGLRKILNFGHTIGHAIESYSLQNDNDSLLHGEAIALGMIAEALLSVWYCDMSTQDYDEVKHRIERFFPHRSYPKSIIPYLISLMQNDKKNSGDQIQMSLLQSIGEATYGIAVSHQDIQKCLQEVL